MGFMPPRNQFDSTSSSSSPAGGSLLDGPPPHDAPRPAGADTAALQGRAAPEEGNPLGMSPKSRIIAALSMLMQSLNIIEGTMPGAISPQMLMEVDSLRTTLPDAVDQMTQQASPLGLLSAMGSALAGPGGGTMGAGLPLVGSPAQSAGMPARPPM